MRMAWLALLVVVVLAPVESWAAGAFSFRSIATDGDGISDFSPAVNSFHMNDAGDTAFLAREDAGSLAVFLYRNGGGLERVLSADGQDYVSVGVPALDGGGTVFVSATPAGGGTVVLKYDGVSTSSILASDATLVQFGDPAVNDDGLVALVAQVATGGQRLVLLEGATLQTLADTTSTFDLLRGPIVDPDGGVSFWGRFAAGGEGVFRVRAGEAPVKISDTEDLAPDQTVYDGFDIPSVNALGEAVFWASWNGFGEEGLLVGTTQGADLRLDSTGPYGTFGFASINEVSAVSFLARLDDGGTAIFLGPDPVGDRVIGPGDSLDGAEIVDIFFSIHSMNDEGQIAFAATLADGRKGLYIADPIPSAAVVSGVPADPTQQTGATLAVGGEDVIRYRYSLDGGAFGAETAATLPIVLTGLADGPHSVAVIARDSRGAWQPEDAPTAVTWTVDTTPPVVTLQGVPDALTEDTSATITVGGEGVVAYRASVDEGPFGPETDVGTPIALTGLAVGAHSVAVIGRDAAGNVQAEGEATLGEWTVVRVEVNDGGGGGGCFISVLDR